jgi:hypothetical protein
MDRHDITEILLKVALNTITPTPLTQFKKYYRLLIKCSIRNLKIVIIFYTWSLEYFEASQFMFLWCLLFSEGKRGIWFLT